VKPQPFTLERHRWYAMQIVLPSGGQYFSPIWIFETCPLQTGKKLLQVSFWHAHYPEGVQDKVYDLRVLRRTKALNASYRGYLLAERTGSSSKDLILLSEITADWIQTHFRKSSEGDLQQWLDRQCPHPRTKTD
jgi:hypothetical protein